MIVLFKQVPLHRQDAPNLSALGYAVEREGTGNNFFYDKHHSDSIYDERIGDGFIVQKNNAKINSEFQWAVLELITTFQIQMSIQRCHDPSIQI